MGGSLPGMAGRASGAIKLREVGGEVAKWGRPLSKGAHNDRRSAVPMVACRVPSPKRWVVE
jgi:hypothetical protein